jgi:sodium-coupled neutral amino acid transporter 11
MGFYPTREAVQKLLGFETATRQPNNVQHYTVTVILFLVITCLGITVRSLGKVYALIGGFAATFLAYILPAAACLVTRRYPAVVGTVSSTMIDDEATIKTPLIGNTRPASSSSSAEDVMLNDDEDLVTMPIILDDSIPKFGLLDASAVLLLIWGVVVMIFATSGVFK